MANTNHHLTRETAEAIDSVPNAECKIATRLTQRSSKLVESRFRVSFPSGPTPNHETTFGLPSRASPPIGKKAAAAHGALGIVQDVDDFKVREEVSLIPTYSCPSSFSVRLPLRFWLSTPLHLPTRADRSVTRE